MYSEFLKTIARNADSCPEQAEILRVARQAGSTPLNRVVHDVGTNRVMISENGAPFEQAPAEISSMFTGVPYRDPGIINPVTAEDGEVRSMLHYLADYYWPEMLEHPRYDEMVAMAIMTLREPEPERYLSSLATNYDRWDEIIEGVFESIDDWPRKPQPRRPI